MREAGDARRRTGRCTHLLVAGRRGGPTVALVALVACLVWLGAVAPASAQEPYSGVVSTRLDRPTMTACAGETNTARATGFLPGAEVTFTLDLPAGPVVLVDVAGAGRPRATANGAGEASVTFALPEGTPPGTYTLVTEGTNATGAADRHEVLLTVTTCPTSGGTSTSAPGRPGSGTDDLARTGADLTGTVRIGVLVVAVGAALVFLARRRRPGIR